MRMRLELLVIALPFDTAFVVHESKLFFRPWGGQARAQMFLNATNPYLRKSLQMLPDRYRKRLADAVQNIEKGLRGEGT